MPRFNRIYQKFELVEQLDGRVKMETLLRPRVIGVECSCGFRTSSEKEMMMHVYDRHPMSYMFGFDFDDKR